jgi:hypothetical protein
VTFPIRSTPTLWHCGGMAATDTALLLLCAGLTLLGLVFTGLAWRRGKRGRVIQGIGLTLTPVALYLTGLLGLVWNAAVALGRWAAALVLSPVVWLGLSLLGLCVVLFVVGGLLARRTARRSARPVSGQERPAVQSAGRPQTAPKAQGGGRGRTGGGQDDDMAEIEALLKSRGIE